MKTSLVFGVNDKRDAGIPALATIPASIALAVSGAGDSAGRRYGGGGILAGYLLIQPRSRKTNGEIGWERVGVRHDEKLFFGWQPMLDVGGTLRHLDDLV
jgi:hypothetical protein